jgi:hypothetical protein
MLNSFVVAERNKDVDLKAQPDGLESDWVAKPAVTQITTHIVGVVSRMT